uniref:FACT complex subunit n=1 Tax=Anthurium amnicola TaxID=1678845 RepID=A0A1D1YRV9_9ARAE
MNLRKIQKRLRALYKSWFKHRDKLWGGVDVLVVSTGARPSSRPAPKSAAFFSWLLGCNLPSTTAIFTPLQIHFLCTESGRVRQLEALRPAACMAVGADLTVFASLAAHQEHVEEFLRGVIDQTQREVASCSAVRSRWTPAGRGDQESGEDREYPVITAGYIADELPEWEEDPFDCDEAWRKKKLAARGFRLAWKDVTLGFSTLARIKGQRQAKKVLEGGETQVTDAPEEEAAQEEKVLVDELEGGGADLGMSGDAEKLVPEGGAEETGKMEDMAAICTWEEVPGCEGSQEDEEDIRKTVGGLDLGGEWVLVGDYEF